MNFLFIVPRDKHFDMVSIPPGVIYVATNLKASGYSVTGLHLSFEEGDEQAISSAIKNNNIDVVLVGGLSSQYTAIKTIIKTVKTLNSGIKTVVGGGMVTAEPELVMANIGADFGVVGQGENTVCCLAGVLETGADPGSVDGLIYWLDGRLKHNPPRAEVKDLDSLPFPDYSIFDYPQIPNMVQHVSGLPKKVLSITASRSCPYNCTFCYHPSGSKYRRRSIDNIFEEIDEMLQKYEIDHVSMVDELFASGKGRLEEFCDRMKPYDLTFACQLRVDGVDEDMLMQLKEAGCILISYGIESADNAILKSMRKNTTIEQTEKALEATRKAGIFIQGFFIFGDIEETQASVQTTLKWWLNHLEYGINLEVIDIFPGTYLYKYAVERGIIANRLEFLEKGCPRTNVSKLSDGEMNQLLDKVIYLSEEFRGATAGTRVQRLHKNGACDMAAPCLHCGHVNHFPEVFFEFKNTRSSAAGSCEKCKSKMKMPPADAISRSTYKVVLDKALDVYFEKWANKRIVIWGATEKTSCLLLGSQCLRDSVVAVVDRDFTFKAGRLLDLFEIQDPQILQNMEFDALVIGAAGYEEEILDTLHTMGRKFEFLDI
ncbi:MAG: radical SAM protein [bacterium]|nr:radical SAM protein [bacterium]